MGFETSMPENNNNKQQESEEDKITEYYKQFPDGIIRDTEIAFNKMNRLEYLKNEAPQELKELFENILDIINTEPKDFPAFTEQIIKAVREAAKEENWTEYNYSFDKIREKLEKYGVPLKKRKTKKDLL